MKGEAILKTDKRCRWKKLFDEIFSSGCRYYFITCEDRAEAINAAYAAYAYRKKHGLDLDISRMNRMLFMACYGPFSDGVSGCRDYMSVTVKGASVHIVREPYTGYHRTFCETKGIYYGL